MEQVRLEDAESYTASDDPVLQGSNWRPCRAQYLVGASSHPSLSCYA
jgi:hypothetical protein